MNWKVVVYNSAVLCILILATEISSYIFRLATDRTTYSLFINHESIPECQKFVFHPILGLARDPRLCDLAHGKKSGQFVIYGDEEEQPSFVIATLGGSTTDGFYQNISNGQSWPYFLQKHCEAILQRNCTVINAGIGGYSSAEELLKLTTEVMPWLSNVDLVISLSGINDMSGYSSKIETQLRYPFFNTGHLHILNLRLFPKLDGKFNVLPNTLANLQGARLRIRGKSINQGEKAGEDSLELEDAVYKEILVRADFKDIGDRWRNNMTSMNAISKSRGATYVSFLQPTMGLNGVEPPPHGTNDSRMFAEIPTDYLSRVNDDYEILRRTCASLSFCRDISHTVPPTGNVFNDPRHHNERGNEELAKVILNEVRKQIK